MNFFRNCQTVAETKARYHKLALQYHPDVSGGDTTETMQEINAQYHQTLQFLNGETVVGSDGKPHTYYYNNVREQAIVEKLNQTLAQKMPNIVVEIVGSWLWVSGDTRPVKETLKKLGYRWHSRRQRWYFHTSKRRSRYAKNLTFTELKNMYGSEAHQSEAAPALQ